MKGLTAFANSEIGNAPQSLDTVWEASVAAQPRYLAGTLRLEAEDAEAEAFLRERWPDLIVTAEGDFGRRARPGEERDQGVGTRGNILAQVNWSLLESGRSARERVLARRREGVEAANSSFNQTFRADVARAYVAASLAGERREYIESARNHFEQLGAVARKRLTEGVEPAEAAERIDSLEKAWATRWREAEKDAGIALLRLALMADDPSVLPMPVKLTAMHELEQPTPTPPALAALRSEAEAQRAEAEVISRSNRWRLEALGQMGPYFSEAFEGRSEQEYFAGLRLSWAPDLAGVQRQRSLAERRRARALDAEQGAWLRQFEQLEAEARASVQDLASEMLEWQDAVNSADAAVRAAELRRQEGVGSWQNVLDAHEALLDARLDELAWRERITIRLIDYAENAGVLDDLPVWIGQGKPTTL